MKHVIDSSVALKWFLAEIDSDKAKRLRDRWQQSLVEMLAPDVFPVEITHALTRAERQGRITPTEGLSLVSDFLAELPVIFPSLPLIFRAYSISSAYHIGVYDCLYVALAEREGCELVTADLRLVSTLGSPFPFIVPLASLP